VLQLLISTQCAFAHVAVIRVEPADGALLADPPTTMILWFDETMVDRFSSVQLVDRQNQPVSGVTMQVDSDTHDRMRVTLPTLPPGSYTLFWKALSDDDGHLSQGFTTFAVGSEAPTDPANATSVGVEKTTVTEGLLRWLNYLLLMTVLGALAMLCWVLPTAQGTPAAVAAQQRLRRHMLWVGAGSAGAAFLLGFALLAWQLQTAQAASAVESALFAQGWELLGRTQWGILWLVRQLLYLFVAGGLWRLATRPKESVSLWLWLFVYGRAVDLAVVQALTGHAGSSHQDWLLTLAATAVHLLAAGVWIGGLLTLCLLFGTVRNEGHQARLGWRPIDWRAFTLAAVVSVGLLFSSGLYRTGQLVISADALLTTRYGQLLLGKVLLVCVVGLCGLANALVVHPRLAVWLGRHLGFRLIDRLERVVGEQALRSARLPRLIVLEATGGLLILGAVALLTASVPPRTVEYTIAPADIKPVLGQRMDDLIVTLQAKPNRIGRNLFSVRGVSTQRAAAPIARVALTFAYLGETREVQEPLAGIAEEVEPGIFQLAGNYLTQAGPWQIDVTIQRHGKADSTAHFFWVAPPAGKIAPVVLSKKPWAEPLTALAAASVLILMVALALSHHRAVPNTSRIKHPYPYGGGVSPKTEP